MKVALYARVSTQRQQEQRTIASQLALLRHHAAEHRYIVEEPYVYLDDGVSGATLVRPGLDRLRDSAEAGRFDAVLVLCPDRLSRKYAYLILIQEELERWGVRLLFLEQPPGDDPHSALLTQIQGAVAEYERAKLAERYRRGKLHRARQGEIFWTSVPFGYRHVPRRDGVSAHVVIDPAQAAIVQKIFTWHADEGVTLRQIAKRLTQSTTPAPRGGNRWGCSTIERIVRNEAYIGTLYYNCSEHSSIMVPPDGDGGARVPKRRVTRRPRDEWISITIPAIITAEIFARSLAHHEPNRRFSPRRLKEERWLLRSLLRCACCGYKHSCVTGNRRSDGQRLYYYRCGKSDGMSDRPPCRPAITHAMPLDEFVWQAVCEHLLNPELLMRARSELTADIPLEEGFLAGQLRDSKRRLQQAHAERDRLLDAYQGGFLNRTEFEARARKLAERISSLEIDSRALQREQNRIGDGRQILQRVGDFTRALMTRLDTMSFHERQDLVRTVLHEVVLDGNQVHLYFKIPLPPPVERSTEATKGPSTRSASSNFDLRSRPDQHVKMDVAVEGRSASRARYTLVGSLPSCLATW